MSPATPFERAAESYTQFAPAQFAAAQELMALLPPDAKRVLEIGAGTGVLTRLLFERYPEAEYFLVDRSPAMLNELDRWAADRYRIRYFCDDVMDVDIEDGYDLIVSSSALHWVSSLSDVLGRVRQWLAPEGRFAASIFVEGTLDDLHAIKSEIVPLKQFETRLPKLDYIRKTLREVGFVPMNERVAEHVIRFPSGRHMLQHLRATGANGHPLVSARLSRKELGRLLVRLEGGVELKYRSYLFVA